MPGKPYGKCPDFPSGTPILNGFGWQEGYRQDGVLPNPGVLSVASLSRLSDSQTGTQDNRLYHFLF